VKKNWISWLRIAALGVFIGRGGQFMIWDAPLSVFLWDESLLKPFVSAIFGLSWSAYLTDYANTETMRLLTRVGAVVLLLSAVAVYFFPLLKKTSQLVILMGTALLFSLSLLYWKDQAYVWPQLIEYTLQWSIPLFYLSAFGKERVSEAWLLLLKIAIAFTFIGHGVYALGIYKLPGNFLSMVMQILKVNQDQAVTFLYVAGIMDFLIAIALFIPFRYGKWLIIYAIFWGLATTLARILGYFYPNNLSLTLSRWLPEAIYRIPHFIAPLVLYLIQRSRRRRQEV